MTRGQASLSAEPAALHPIVVAAFAREGILSLDPYQARMPSIDFYRRGRLIWSASYASMTDASPSLRVSFDYHLGWTASIAPNFATTKATRGGC